jgi:hypothetical protein
MPLAPWHATAGGYNNHKCRCDRCRAAWATYWREGAGAASKVRYYGKLITAGKVLSGGQHGTDRQREYRPRPNAARPRGPRKKR